MVEPPRHPRTRETEADRLRKARERAQARDITLPPPRNPRRRRQCAADPERFLRTYLPLTFFNPFTADLRDMLAAIVSATTTGGNVAIAGPRGCGKTSVIKGAIVYGLCYGRIRFAVLIGKNQAEGYTRLTELRTIFESNERLAEDFPETCLPIRALEGWASRGRLQTVGGVHTHIKWSGTHIILPTVAGSPASGAIAMALGRESVIRGQNIRDTRPDLVIVDDVEDPESIRSETQTAIILKTIKETIAGLAGPGQTLAIVYPCTIARRGCVADQLTDRTREPSWQGRRYQLLNRKPDAADLWAEFIERRHDAQFRGDPTARAAHRFYMEHRREMDAGADVSNPYRFDAQRLPDGSHNHVSALEQAYCFIADFGPEAFETEYQNAPPAEEAAHTIGNTLYGIMGRTNGGARGLVPEGTDHLVAAIDIHSRALYWTVCAFAAGRGHVIDYGADPVHAPIAGRANDPEDSAAFDAAILAALLAWRDREAEHGWPTADTGELRHIDLGLVDSGWRPDPAAEFVRSSPQDLYRITKGEGTARGQNRFRAPARRGHGRRLGPHWFAARDPVRRVWTYHLDADHFKLCVGTGFLLPPNLAGSMTLFGSNPVAHKTFAEHILAEVWTEEFPTGRGAVRYWDVRSHRNHWLDCTAGCWAAAEILGMRTVTTEAAAAMIDAQAAPDETAVPTHVGTGRPAHPPHPLPTHVRTGRRPKRNLGRILAERRNRR